MFKPEDPNHKKCGKKCAIWRIWAK